MSFFYMLKLYDVRIILDEDGCCYIVRIEGNLWKGSSSNNCYCPWDGGMRVLLPLRNFSLVLCVKRFFIIYLHHLFMLIIISGTNWIQFVRIVACFMAIFVKDDHTTSLHWCSCHGKSCFVSFWPSFFDKVHYLFLPVENFPLFMSNLHVLSAIDNGISHLLLIP